MSEIIFEVQEDLVDGGFVATALGHAIATQAETLEELREMVRDAPCNVTSAMGPRVPCPRSSGFILSAMKCWRCEDTARRLRR